ncbi:hypothetical protein HELRODRAFT_194432 [Helobdella robusta]|uniref:N-glycosylase/DNA lyase n=1 Tax=Helobdella robusta TaxID=6412 RepID=T1FW18_HELRO|nr:hypothetical protein HELRODRAFT_194432 [Helobdella robusta]ESN92062.1 hypothetical protein HELRODRAFT_194432 [Helobdella robusta]
MKMKLTKKYVDDLAWSSLIYPKDEFDLALTLRSGQSFRWLKYDDGSTTTTTDTADQWIGVVENDVWILRQNRGVLQYKIINDNNINNYIINNKFDNISNNDSPIHKNPNMASSDSSQDSKIRNYFHLDLSLLELHKQFTEKDKDFLTRFPSSKSVRLLRQNPVEVLFSFICSTNNNIRRICNMVECMCRLFGAVIVQIDGKAYHKFPTVSSLAETSVEAELKKSGFGYRAKFINETAKKLLKEHENNNNNNDDNNNNNINNVDDNNIDDSADGRCERYLFGLRNGKYDDAKKILLQYPGIGPKVADCICLMSLDQLNAVPVDTHVRQVAEKIYNFKMEAKSLTTNSYDKISTFFQSLWGRYAGWAQSIAFSGQLNLDANTTTSSVALLKVARNKRKRKK